MFHIKLSFVDDLLVPKIRANDTAIMTRLVSLDIYSTAEQVQLNRVRHYHCVHYISELLLCDGVTIDPAVTTKIGVSALTTFSISVPQRQNSYFGIKF